MTAPHLAEQLWAEHAPPEGYPAGVVPVPEPIPGTSFFPGGHGLYDAAEGRPLPPFPVGGVMVLAHDFHAETGYRESLALRRERATLPTWRNLVPLLREAGVDLGRCFFTNAYMGLRAGSASVGVFPGARDAGFVAHCRRFLLRQLAVQRPALVLTLGVYAPRVLAPLSPDLSDWAGAGGFKPLDVAGPVRAGATFPGAPGVEATVVALTHPCLWHAAVRHRRYGGEAGGAAERRMLRDALADGRVRAAVGAGA